MKKKIEFSKMHALGNDFMIINNLTEHFFFTPKTINKLSNRYFGIGFDQLLIIEKSKNLKIDFFYKIFNADGTEVNQCGNGARCFAHFIFLKKLTNKKCICISTHEREMIISNIDNKNEIMVNIGKPIFNPEKIPFLVDECKQYYNLNVHNEHIKCSVVSVGNPHCIIQVKNIKKTPVQRLGSLIEKHVLFPKRTNVGFVEIVKRNEINLRVFERGVGETNACGSGACAAAAIGIMQKKLNNNVKVNLVGGSLKIYWKGIGNSMFLTGPATHVYDGYIYL